MKCFLGVLVIGVFFLSSAQGQQAQDIIQQAKHLVQQIENIPGNFPFAACVSQEVPEQDEKCDSLTNNQDDLSQVAKKVQQASLSKQGFDEFFSLVGKEYADTINANWKFMEFFVGCQEGKYPEVEECDLISDLVLSSLRAVTPWLRQELALASDGSSVKSTDPLQLNTIFVGDIYAAKVKRPPLSAEELNQITKMRQGELKLVEENARKLYAQMKNYPAYDVSIVAGEFLKEMQSLHYMNYLTILNAYPIFRHVSEDDIAKGLKTKSAIEGIRQMIKGSQEHEKEILEAIQDLKNESGKPQNMDILRKAKKLKDNLNPKSLQALFEYPPALNGVLRQHPEYCMHARIAFSRLNERVAYHTVAEQALFLGLLGTGKVASVLLKNSPRAAKVVGLANNAAMMTPMIYPYLRDYQNLSKRLNHLGTEVGGKGFASQREILEAKQKLLNSPVELAVTLAAFNVLDPMFSKAMKWILPTKGPKPAADFLAP